MAEPAPTNFACKRLAKALADYEKAEAELGDHRSRISKAADAEAASIADERLSEVEAIRKISEAQQLKSITRRGVAHREAQVCATWHST